MRPTRIGVLSDTHITKVTPDFQEKVNRCFADCSMIIHAGDLTSAAVLSAFAGKEVHAVHGNMCDFNVCRDLPTKKTVTVGGFTIGVIHRCGRTYDFEDLLLAEFDAVDCVVYGHTHKPVCRLIGRTLFVNPGSFRDTGRYGSPGTYAVIEAGDELRATLRQVPAVR